MEVARRSQTNKAEMYRKAEEVGKIPNLNRCVKLFSEQEDPQRWSKERTLKKYRNTLVDHFRQLIIPPSVWLRAYCVCSLIVFTSGHRRSFRNHFSSDWNFPFRNRPLVGCVIAVWDESNLKIPVELSRLALDTPQTDKAAEHSVRFGFRKFKLRIKKSNQFT